ncbi:MAG: hypothetical protein IKK52_06985 [Alphaproteobacteria bacterium]|nr:hypothetical protein [Alphaproteobacteria bacterium]
MKKLLLLTGTAALLSMTGNARADDMDITSPFYLPSKNEILSDTALTFQKMEFKDAPVAKDFILHEEIDLGIAEQTALRFVLGNRFNFDHFTSQQYNNDLNLDYEIGMAKNLPLTERLKMQLRASYYTYDPKSWYGHSRDTKTQIRNRLGSSRWYKALQGDVKLGYELEDGLMPYATFSVDGNVDSSNRDLGYSAFAGLHKNEYTFAYDVGLRYEFSTENDDSDSWFMQGSSDYFINDNTTIGGYVDYRFGGSYTPKVDYGYTLGARFKIRF